jgi:hypothetical protein
VTAQVEDIELVLEGATPEDMAPLLRALERAR